MLVFSLNYNWYLKLDDFCNYCCRRLIFYKIRYSLSGWNGWFGVVGLGSVGLGLGVLGVDGSANVKQSNWFNKQTKKVVGKRTKAKNKQYYSKYF